MKLCLQNLRINDGVTQNEGNNTMDAQLDPQAQALLEQMAMAADISDRVSPEEKLIAARESHRAVIPLAGEPEPVRNIYERHIPSESGNIPVRIYAPNEDSSTLR